METILINHKSLKSYCIIGFLVVVFCLVSSGAVSANAVAAMSSSITLFDRLDQGNNNGNWQKDAGNVNGQYAWGESYVMLSYLYMYETTLDRSYLDKFVNHADSVLAHTDKALGKTDYRGSSLPAWSSTKYSVSRDKPYVWGVHTGMIIYPIVRFCNLVLHDPTLREYKATATGYLVAAKAALSVHDAEWNERGEYVFPKDAPIPKGRGDVYPFNQTAALGRAYLALWQASGEPIYLEKVKKMGFFLRNQLVNRYYDAATNSYVWPYGWTELWKGHEDISHASIEVDFIYLLHQANLCFTELDMIRIGNTLERKIIKPNGRIAYYVNGDFRVKLPTDGDPSSLGRWIKYYRWSPSLYRVVKQAVDGYSAVSASELLTVALLLHTEKARKTPHNVVRITK